MKIIDPTLMKIIRYACLFALTSLSAACGVDGPAAEKTTVPQAQAASPVGTASSQSGQAKPGVVMPIKLNVALSDAGKLEIEAGDVTLRLAASGCNKQTETLSLCNKDVELTVVAAGGEVNQVLQPASIYINSEATLYRGPLDASYTEGGHTFVLTDLNGDGHDDLLVWSGKEGAYGGASYNVYLFDADKREFVLSQEFSDLTVGYDTLFHIEGKQLKTVASDGCCMHIYDTYVVENNAPKLIERVTEETSGTGTVEKRKVEKLVNDQLKEVKE